MRRGNPEDPDHRIPDELLDHAAVSLDMSRGHRGVGREHPIDVFGIRCFRGGGETHEIAEERGDDLALFGRIRTRRPEPRTALATEPLSRPVSYTHLTLPTN